MFRPPIYHHLTHSHTLALSLHTLYAYAWTSLKAFDAKLCKRDGCNRGRIVGNKCRGRPCSAATVDHHSIFERSLAASIQTASIAGTAQEQGTVGLCRLHRQSNTAATLSQRLVRVLARCSRTARALRWLPSTCS